MRGRGRGARRLIAGSGAGDGCHQSGRLCVIDDDSFPIRCAEDDDVVADALIGQKLLRCLTVRLGPAGDDHHHIAGRDLREERIGSGQQRVASRGEVAVVLDERSVKIEEPRVPQRREDKLCHDRESSLQLGGPDSADGCMHLRRIQLRV